jgi:pimeloyl-ACP methyl ester carboxylesterase
MRRRTAPAWAVLGLLLVVAGCAAPIRVTKVTPEQSYRELTQNALSTDEPSDASMIVLRRFALAKQFADDPGAAIQALHAAAATAPGRSDTLFALAELSFLHARRTHSRPHYLAATVYALAFLLPEAGDRDISLIDRRARVAADLYGAALAEAFRPAAGAPVEPRSGTYALPFGQLDVAFDPRSLWYGQRYLYDFLPESEFEVEGLRNYYHRSGLGAALVARTAAPNGQAVTDLVGPRVRVPSTLLLKVDHPREQIRGTQLQGRLELRKMTDSGTVTLDEQRLPLELDYSTALGLTLVDARPWESELSRLLGTALHVKLPTRLAALHPHQRGRIPVVLIHGTASSPATWADMMNDLLSYREFRDRYEIWVFMYDSGNPIAYSSMLLRRALVQAVKALDPDGTDRCLRHMVLVGHSQGGLLTKMMVVDSGSRFWDAVSSTPFEQAKLSPSTRALLTEALFVKPLPFVSTVVFMSTPHRGSYLAGPQFVRRLAQRLIAFPGDLLAASGDLLGVRGQLRSELGLQRLPTSIDNMSPGNPFIQTLSTIPIAPGVAAHSIIAVKGEGPVESGSDGVVRYQSAHIEGVESELVIRSGHSVQQTAPAVQELLRILEEHGGQVACGDEPADQPATPTGDGATTGAPALPGQGP